MASSSQRAVPFACFPEVAPLNVTKQNLPLHSSRAKTLRGPQARVSLLLLYVPSSSTHTGMSHLAESYLPPPLAVSTQSYSNDIIAGAIAGLFIPNCPRDV